jgi:hypothetical protein
MQSPIVQTATAISLFVHTLAEKKNEQLRRWSRNFKIDQIHFLKVKIKREICACSQVHTLRKQTSTRTKYPSPNYEHLTNRQSGRISRRVSKKVWR